MDDLRCRECLVLTLCYYELLFLFISNKKHPELSFVGTGGRMETGREGGDECVCGCHGGEVLGQTAHRLLSPCSLGSAGGEGGGCPALLPLGGQRCSRA